MGGKETKPEGFVAIRNGRPSKLVDRAEFSRTNFLQGAFQKGNEPKPEPNEDTPTNPVVTSFGRMNPPTKGHGVLVDKVKELAKENKAKQVIALSRSQDPEKNPLTPEQKIKHVKRMFPDAQVELADESEPTMIGHMKKLQKAGHDHVVMVVGSDRVDEVKALLDRYNGKDFNFKKIDVVSAGQRDADAEDEDPSSVSATRQRAHAITNKRKEFQKGVPDTLHPEHADELFNDVKRGMDIEIGPETNGISLARYAKRQDPIGVKARREQERRLRQKEIEKAAKKKKPKTPVTESMTATGGDIRGMGYVTGQVGGALTWAALNQSDADTRDQVMNQAKNEYHDKLHATPNLASRKDLFIQRLVNSIKDRSQ
jgi:nicotinic acid mononucleotide adenylyltransferase